MATALGFPLYHKLIRRTENRPVANFPGGKAKYVTIHNTGNSAIGADAAAHANWVYNDADYSWHLTVDDKEAWQHLMLNEQGWHAGDGGGLGNTQSIGIEICMNAGIDQLEAENKAAELTAGLLREHIQDPPFDESYDFEHWVKQHNNWSGKNCPQVIRESGRWLQFISDVRDYYFAEEPDVPEIDPEYQALAKRIAALERQWEGLHQRLDLMAVASGTYEDMKELWEKGRDTGVKYPGR